MTVFVRANCSGDAVKFMHNLVSDEDENFPFADFRYRTAVPEICLPVDPIIYNAYDK